MAAKPKPWELIEHYLTGTTKACVLFERIQAARRELYGIILAGWENESDDLPSFYYVGPPGFERYDSGRQQYPYIYLTLKGIRGAQTRIQSDANKSRNITATGLWCWEHPDEHHAPSAEYNTLRTLLPASPYIEN